MRKIDVLRIKLLGFHCESGFDALLLEYADMLEPEPPENGHGSLGAASSTLPRREAVILQPYFAVVGAF